MDCLESLECAPYMKLVNCDNRSDGFEWESEDALIANGTRWCCQLEQAAGLSRAICVFF